METDSALPGNRHSDEAEVSRRHISRTPIVMDGAGRRPEPEDQWVAFAAQFLHARPGVGVFAQSSSQHWSKSELIGQLTLKHL